MPEKDLVRASGDRAVGVDNDGGVAQAARVAQRGAGDDDRARLERNLAK